MLTFRVRKILCVEVLASAVAIRSTLIGGGWLKHANAPVISRIRKFKSHGPLRENRASTCVGKIGRNEPSPNVS